MIQNSDLDTDKAMELVFATGLSTAQKGNLIAGRGMGMDLVRRQVQMQGGKIEPRFSPGEFCEFRVILPI